MKRSSAAACVAVAVVLVVAAGLMALRGGAGVPGEGEGLPGSAGGAPGGEGFARIPEDSQYSQNWPQFRGPGGMGLVPDGEWPQYWDAASGAGILWKSPVPVPGQSSPVTWGGRIFLTGADEAHREVLCYSRATGDLLWRTDIPLQPSRHGDEHRRNFLAAVHSGEEGQDALTSPFRKRSR